MPALPASLQAMRCRRVARLAAAPVAPGGRVSLLARRRAASLRLSTTLSLQNRLSPCARVRLEAGDDFLRDLALEQSLDVTQEFTLIDAHQ
jgi:hypothetical protein